MIINLSGPSVDEQITDEERVNTFANDELASLDEQQQQQAVFNAPEIDQDEASGIETRGLAETTTEMTNILGESQQSIEYEADEEEEEIENNERPKRTRKDTQHFGNVVSSDQRKKHKSKQWASSLKQANVLND